MSRRKANALRAAMAPDTAAFVEASIQAALADRDHAKAKDKTRHDNPEAEIPAAIQVQLALLSERIGEIEASLRATTAREREAERLTLTRARLIRALNDLPPIDEQK